VEVFELFGGDLPVRHLRRELEDKTIGRPVGQYSNKMDDPMKWGTDGQVRTRYAA
jgi:hypothetical protein